MVNEAARAASGELAVAIQSGRRVPLGGDNLQLPPLYTKPMVRTTASELQWSDRKVLSRRVLPLKGGSCKARDERAFSGPTQCGYSFIS